MDKLFLLLVVDVNSVWNGLQVISGFVLGEETTEKRIETGATERVFFYPL